MTLSDEALEEPWFVALRADFNRALPNLIAGKPDRTDLMLPIDRVLNPRHYVTLTDIVNAVAKETKVRPGQIRGKSRRADVCRARHMAFFIASDVFRDRTESELAQMLKRDRTTVSNSVQRATDLMEDDGEFYVAYHRTRAALGLNSS